MQKNWYMLYVKKNSEKRASAALKKNKIQNFCPLKCRQIKHLRTTRLCYEPLFGSYLFANLTEGDFALIKRVKNVVNIVHWIDKPAIIANEEIEAIKEFHRLHQNISIEKYQANNNQAISIIDVPSYSIGGNTVLVKTNLIKVHLPSLRLVMVVEIKSGNMFGEGEAISERSSQKEKVV